MPPLISAQALRESPASWTVLDCSFDLTEPQAGERSYREGHLPGAHYVHLDRDLSAALTGTNGRHPLRSRAEYAAWMGQLGITPATPVVVYDAQGAMFAVRAWWVLRWMGHTQVAVLDGGLPAWRQAGGALSTEQPAPHAATPYQQPYPPHAPALPTLSAAELQPRLAEVLVIDARAPERYRGEVEPLDAVAGHIPGARNRFFKDNLQANGCFKPAAQLHAEYSALLDGRPVVHQCGSGVTACHNLLAMEWAGLGTTALYPGSWSEWCSDPTRPMARR